MKPPEGRGQPFSGPELLNGGTSVTGPCSHLYIFSTASDDIYSCGIIHVTLSFSVLYHSK